MYLLRIKFLIISSFVFFFGFSGLVFNRLNLIVVLLCVELMLLAVNLNFIVNSLFLDDFIGSVFSLFILTVAAAESAIGLAIIVAFYRINGRVALESIYLLRG